MNYELKLFMCNATKALGRYLKRNWLFIFITGLFIVPVTLGIKAFVIGLVALVTMFIAFDTIFSSILGAPTIISDYRSIRDGNNLPYIFTGVYSRVPDALSLMPGEVRQNFFHPKRP